MVILIISSETTSICYVWDAGELVGPKREASLINKLHQKDHAG